ncbi:IS5/IS1182 family transposase, partial [Staphylococcus haemolyticus]|nr:IS5/IS1182 family transposase [Staphylococcus haemolyticus]MDU0450124.1 IS5/IS1182 family transposase [Staphylococcus haemolyticus]MDU0486911.1 IS5/IS1182 family transposase [Staphylococcus haemolyticus]MDU0491547.1 IS5/IS1182 family transposase [Staphylococcus haemolyticus]
AENNQKIYKKDNFYIISIEIVFFSLIQELYVPDSFFIVKPLWTQYYCHQHLTTSTTIDIKAIT